MRSRIAAGMLAAVVVLFVSACASKPDGIARGRTVPTSRCARLQCFRTATPHDLQLTLTVRPDPAEEFPWGTVKVYNTSPDEVIVGYEPGCIVLHCGQFERQAPGLSFVQRREILRSQQALEFAVPPGGWMNSPASGDLMVPMKLFPGKYDLWATFQLAGESTPTVESPHETFVVR